MRYFLLLVIPALLTLLKPQIVTAAEAKSTNTVGETPLKLENFTDFWSSAQQLVQEQIYLVNRIEIALGVSTDLHRLESVWGQLFLHQGKVERFLNSQYSSPARLCRPESSSDSLSTNPILSIEQKQVYCALYTSTQQLAPIKSFIDRRLPRLMDLSTKNPLLLEKFEGYNFRVPALARSQPIANIPPAEPSIIDKPNKTAIADYVPPIAPAIAASEQAMEILQTTKQLLAITVAAFPKTIKFNDPTDTNQALEYYTYNVPSYQTKLYSEFLAMPNTGITLLLPTEFYQSKLKPLENRLIPPIKERFPFATLLPNKNGLIPQLSIQIENGNFQIDQPGLNYGLIMDLGDIALENLTQVSAAIPENLLKYQPPTQLEALQVERRRFLTGKLTNFPVNKLGFTQAPAVLNHTYLVRLIQFKLPEVILNKGIISRSDRLRIEEILKTPSSDIMVVFRAVNCRRDGSYTVLWRVLSKFPDPQIEDLEKYIYLE